MYHIQIIQIMFLRPSFSYYFNFLFILDFKKEHEILRSSANNGILFVWIPQLAHRVITFLEYTVSATILSIYDKISSIE